MKYKVKKSNVPGYTLIEVLVSLSIVAIVFTVVGVNFRSYGFQGEADLTAHRFASDLRLIQSLALGLKEFDDGFAGSDNRPNGGWGIYFDKIAGNNDKYTVFADHWDGSTQDAPDHLYNPGGGANQELSSVVDLGQVRVSELLINSIPVDQLSIVVQPPNPTTWICDYASSCSATTSAEIIFENKGRQASVKVNTYGLIDVYD